MEHCDTYVKERTGRQVVGHDLWCRTHNMWVYQSLNSELLNHQHEILRWPNDSPSRP